MPCSPSSGAQKPSFISRGVRGKDPGGHARPRSSTHTDSPASPSACAATAPPKPEPTTTTSNASPSAGGPAASSAKDVERAFDRPREHGALTALDDRPLQERRPLGEGLEHRLVVVERQVLRARLACAHEVTWPRARLRHQRAELVPGERLDVVLDPVEVDPALLEELRELPARGAGALLVDHDVGHERNLTVLVAVDARRGPARPPPPQPPPETEGQKKRAGREPT